MRLLFKSKHLIRGKYGNPSKRRKSLSEKSIVSNWSNVAPIFSICGILYPEKFIFDLKIEILFNSNVKNKKIRSFVVVCGV